MIEHTRDLAGFVSRSRWDELPPRVQHEAVRAFVNWVGCAWGGAEHPATRIALAALRGLSASQQCSVLGHEDRMDPLSAAMLNGLSASAHAYDDTHLETVAHPTAPAAAALLAQAETRAMSGQEFLLGLVLANEVQTRIACAMAAPPAQCHVGLYMTGHAGAAGVAAGVARALGLTPQQTVWAIGTGATQGGGFRASHGSMCSGLIPANAGRGGLLAARLAACDFSCNDAALEAVNGFLDTLAHPAHPEALTQGLGTHWECMKVAAKPFPAGVFIHPTIDACLQLARESVLPPQDIERVELAVHTLALGLTGRPEPRHGYDAQVSVYHWAAAVLLRGRAGLAESSDACVADPEVVALRRRVSAGVDESLGPEQARVEVLLRDGRRFAAGGEPCLGTAGHPMSDSQIDAKFMDQAAPRLGAARARELADRCWNIASAADLARAAPGFWG